MTYEALNILLHSIEIGLHKTPKNEIEIKILRFVLSCITTFSKGYNFYKTWKKFGFFEPVDQNQDNFAIKLVTLSEALVEIIKLATAIADLQNNDPKNKSYKKAHNLLCCVALFLAIAKTVLENIQEKQSEECSAKNIDTKPTVCP